MVGSGVGAVADLAQDLKTTLKLCLHYEKVPKLSKSSTLLVGAGGGAGCVAWALASAMIADC